MSPRRRTPDERGVAAVVVAVFISALLFGLAAVAVDLARLQLEGQKLQKAADAAATAGVTWMPQDLPNATSTARELASRNGYTGTGSSAITVAPGQLPGQLDVTISSTIPNLFGEFLGIGSGTVTRHAVADYTGPQPMGSPCNTMGTEPDDDSSGGGSKLANGTECNRYPQFWMNAFGPDTKKESGDEYATRTCAGHEVDCTSDKKNRSFDPQGYFFMIRVGAAAVGQQVTVEIYDPAFVSTNDRCDGAPSTTSSFPWPSTSNDDNPDRWNPWTTRKALDRYAKNPGTFCTGDQLTGGTVATTTSYGLRRPSADANPLNGVPVADQGCTRQYPGYAAPTVGNLEQFKLSRTNTTQANLEYKPEIAQLFHQWVKLCSFTPAAAGDYYLQVRTNVAIGGPVNDAGSYRPTSNAASAIYTQAGDNPNVHGHGSNRFALRAFGQSGTVSAAVSVSAWGKMPIYVNTDAASSEFNLIRVLPGAAGKTLVFKFFDAGDAASNGTMTVLMPKEATGDQISHCVGTGFKNVVLPTCSITGIKKTETAATNWDGQSESISVPIPSNYGCNYASPGGCWFRVRVGFGSGTVTDTTTWTASVEGDPVRLIE